jgi:hypothetical protein
MSALSSIYRGTILGVSNLWARAVSRWVVVGAVGLGIFGVGFVLRFGHEKETLTRWVFGAIGVLSVVALVIGAHRTRRMWSVDAGGA